MFRMGHHLLKAGLGVSGENALHHLRGLQQRRAMKVCRSTPTKQWELQRLKFTVVPALDGMMLREAPSFLPAAQARRTVKDSKPQATKQWEGPSMPVVSPGNATLLKGSEFTSLLGPQNAVKEAEGIRFKEHEGQGGGFHD